MFAALASNPALAETTGNTASYQAMKWRLVGPHRGGRVTAVAGHERQPYTYYMGATGGGVWKTTDAGQTWNNVSDGYLKTGTIGAIAVAPSDPDVVYVGTGESPIRGVTTSHGDGVYKSTDGGETWVHLGLEDTRQISKIKIHPKNPDVVYVGAQGNPWGPSQARGVYRSSDGGKNWQRVLFVNETTGASLLDIDVNSPDTLYAAMWDHQRLPWDVRSGGPGSGLWKTTDGGANWTEIGNGLPEQMGNTGVTVSPADPNRLYAMIEAAEGGIYRSDDGGASWQYVNADPGIRDRGWYYTHIFADPQDADSFYVLAAAMVKSTDGGETLEEIETPHGDNHDLWINPAHPDWMVQGNDGGANVSFNGGKTWSTQMNQPTAQFYRVITDTVWPYRLYGGQQDNSSVRITSFAMDGGIGRADWRAVGGGESAHFGFDRDDPTLVYGTSLLGSLTEYNEDTGEVRRIDSYPYFAGFRPGRELKYRYNWNAPVVVSQHDPEIVYHAAQLLLKSTDRGLSWEEISPDLTRNDPEKLGTTGGPIMIEGAGGEHYATLMYIAESPHDARVIWAGSDDGLVHVTRDGGESWQNVTPPDMPEGQVNAIDVSPHDPATAYFAMTRYKLNDFQPFIYKTGNYGRSWTRIDQGLPRDHFTRVVREDVSRKGLLFAGTEAGVFVSFDDGGSWRSLQLDLPLVPITDLKVHGNDLVAATQGRAYWILDGLQPLRQIDSTVENAPVHLFEPAEALRLNVGRPRSEPHNNPDYGATFYYSFNQPPAEEVTLQILDTQGDIVRSFSSIASEAQDGGFVKGVQGEPPADPLPVQAGQNRYVWNLRAEPMIPVSDTIRYVSNRPYRVAPGEYTVRLEAGEQLKTQRLRVIGHPGKPYDAAGWAEQEVLVKSLYEMVNEVHIATNQMRSVATQVMAAMESSSAEGVLQAGADLLAKLTAWEEQVPQPPLPGGLEDRIAYPSHLLSIQVLHLMAIVDQGPPVSQPSKESAARLEQAWASFTERQRDIIEGDLTAFTALLKDGQAVKVPQGVEPVPRPY
ncbi:MAG: hypothetical protein RQ826_02615 [Xanthomonadales bacterium]|nr:hypothetical protein [Xanthomonadales bacterium]